jgi:hypothetical protein
MVSESRLVVYGPWFSADGSVFMVESLGLGGTGLLGTTVLVFTIQERDAIAVLVSQLSISFWERGLNLALGFRV